MEDKIQQTALVTGAAGFIGFHIAKKLLDEGWRVLGLDCMSDYYDVKLKKEREGILLKNPHYQPIYAKVETKNTLVKIFEEEHLDIVIHLAAQAGVRYSIDNPRAYLESNIIGTFELLEAARRHPPKHLLLASTSSTYGANENMPYRETDKADHQVSFYAASKKATENIAHSYSHLYTLPVTMFRFFTVYGPWGRPDMAPFKFTKRIFDGEAIDIYNNGEMKRDFTYIDDIVQSIRLLVDCVPKKGVPVSEKDSISFTAPFRIVNIGNSEPINLLDFINCIEKVTGRKALKNYMTMQSGDVVKTWADNDLLEALTHYKPNTSLFDGINAFVSWYAKFYNINLNK